jgi:hypothetical protein
MDTNNDGVVSHEELNQAIQILEKAKKEKQQNPTSKSTTTSTNGSGGSSVNSNGNGNGVTPNLGDNIKNTLTKYMNGN